MAVINLLPILSERELTFTFAICNRRSVCLSSVVCNVRAGLYSTTATYLASKEMEIGEKRKIRAMTPFKVIQGHRGRYQSKARMRLPIFRYVLRLRRYERK